MGDEVIEKEKLPGYLGTYDIDCKKVILYVSIIIYTDNCFIILYDF